MSEVDTQQQQDTTQPQAAPAPQNRAARLAALRDKYDDDAGAEAGSEAEGDPPSGATVPGDAADPQAAVSEPASAPDPLAERLKQIEEASRQEGARAKERLAEKQRTVELEARVKEAGSWRAKAEAADRILNDPRAMVRHLVALEREKEKDPEKLAAALSVYWTEAWDPGLQAQQRVAEVETALQSKLEARIAELEGKLTAREKQAQQANLLEEGRRELSSALDHYKAHLPHASALMGKSPKAFFLRADEVADDLYAHGESVTPERVLQILNEEYGQVAALFANGAESSAGQQPSPAASPSGQTAATRVQRGAGTLTNAVAQESSSGETRKLSHRENIARLKRKYG